MLFRNRPKPARPKPPDWFQIPDGLIGEVIQARRLQLDCVVNSDDHCRLVLQITAEDLLNGFVIDRLLEDDDSESWTWWNHGFDPASQGSFRPPNHLDVIEMANRAVDQILTLRRDGRLDLSINKDIRHGTN